MRRKKNKQMEGQMSIFDMFSSVIENTKTEEENVTVSEGGIAAADITAVETGTQTSIFDLFSTDEQDTQKQEKKPKKNFFHRTIQFAKSLEDKWKNNLAALKMLLGLDDYADEDQQTILSSYEGWGGLSSYFEVEEKKVQLETLVGENTYKGIKSSILTSYYTNEKIINFMYQILSEIGVKGKLNILDPCMGTGNFYRMLPDTLQDSNLYGVELEETSCNIAKQLFQKANIQNCAFEKADLPNNYFDLIIGNVPFSDFSAADNTYGSCLILESGMIEKLILNDLDPNVYAFWNIVCSDHYKELIQRIKEYQPSRESYFLYQKRMLKANISEVDRAFYFLVINRCSFSGIQTANPKSNMEDRWLSDTLIKRIEKIHSMSDRIEVTNKNAMELIEEMYWSPDNCIFIDPPYIEKGDCLYPVKFHLHQELAALITELLREFPGCADILLTYDDQKILHELYDQNHIGIHMIGRKYSCSR